MKIKVVLALLLILCLSTIPTAAQDDRCDASIVVDVIARDCLDPKTGWARGWLTLHNEGTTGNSRVVVDLYLTRGLGTDSLSFVYPITQYIGVLQPGDIITSSLFIDIILPSKHLPLSAQVTAIISDESCQPEINLGRAGQEDFPWCDCFTVFLPSIHKNYLYSP